MSELSIIMEYFPLLHLESIVVDSATDNHTLNRRERYKSDKSEVVGAVYSLADKISIKGGWKKWPLANRKQFMLEVREVDAHGPAANSNAFSSRRGRYVLKCGEWGLEFRLTMVRDFKIVGDAIAATILYFSLLPLFAPAFSTLIFFCTPRLVSCNILDICCRMRNNSGSD